MMTDKRVNLLVYIWIITKIGTYSFPLQTRRTGVVLMVYRTILHDLENVMFDLCIERRDYSLLSGGSDAVFLILVALRILFIAVREGGLEEALRGRGAKVSNAIGQEFIVFNNHRVCTKGFRDVSLRQQVHICELGHPHQSGVQLMPL